MADNSHQEGAREGRVTGPIGEGDIVEAIAGSEHNASGTGALPADYDLGTMSETLKRYSSDLNLAIQKCERDRGICDGDESIIPEGHAASKNACHCHAAQLELLGKDSGNIDEE